jgi:hypothetical protein
MKQSLFAVMAAGLVFGSAAAGPLCATPGELKLLKAAMLEQVLTSAALSCHQNAAFDRFVAAYHNGMVANERALKAFFARRKTGESYEAYKARIAQKVAASSLQDGRFCEEAARVFDIALQHKQAQAPKLIATGYEHCAAPQAPVMAKVDPALRPVKPAAKPVPVPVLSTAAREALALANRRDSPLPQSKPPTRMAAMPPARLSPVMATAVPAKRLPLQAELAVPVTSKAETIEDVLPSRDPVPNAYKPGAYWVNDAVQQAPERHHLVQGADGRWYVLIGHQDHWTND